MDRREVEFISGKHKLVGTLYHPAAQSGMLLPAVVFFHGRGSSQKRYLPRAEQLAERGFITFTFDFRGCGGSQGDFNKLTLEDGITDALTAYDYLLDQPGVDKNRVGINGGSYGGYLAAIISSRRIVPSMVLDAPAIYKDYWLKLAYDVVPVEEISKFRNDGDTSDTMAIAAIKRYVGTLLVIRHENDEVIPAAVVESYALNAKTHRKEVAVIPNAPHRLEGEAYEKASELTVDWFARTL